MTGEAEERLREAGVRDRDGDRKLVEDRDAAEDALEDDREKIIAMPSARTPGRVSLTTVQTLRIEREEADERRGHAVAVLEEDAAHHLGHDLPERERPVGYRQAGARAGDEPAQEEQHPGGRRRQDGEPVSRHAGRLRHRQCADATCPSSRRACGR